MAGLGVFDMIPDYRHRCPACGGSDCAVRHGHYTRRVISRGTIYEHFPVPRFRCRDRGPRQRAAATFSVLPEQLLPRKQPSLPLVVWMLDRLLISTVSLSTLLDELAETFHRHPEPWLPEVSTIYRLLRLFASARSRVDRITPVVPVSRPSGAVEPASEPTGRSPRRRASEMLHLLADKRGSPIIGRYHRVRFPRLLFGPLRPIHPT